MFSDKLKGLRTSQQGLTQAKFAEILGVSQQAVGLWERGKNMPSKDVLIKIADFFGVTTDFLMGRPLTACEIWKSITLESVASIDYLSKKIGLSAIEINYLEHGREDKISNELYDKLLYTYINMTTTAPVEKVYYPDIYNIIEGEDTIRYDGKFYKLDETTKEKLHAAIRLALM